MQQVEQQRHHHRHGCAEHSPAAAAPPRDTAACHASAVRGMHLLLRSWRQLRQQHQQHQQQGVQGSPPTTPAARGYSSRTGRRMPDASPGDWCVPTAWQLPAAAAATAMLLHSPPVCLPLQGNSCNTAALPVPQRPAWGEEQGQRTCVESPRCRVGRCFLLRRQQPLPCTQLRGRCSCCCRSSSRPWDRRNGPLSNSRVSEWGVPRVHSAPSRRCSSAWWRRRLACPQACA